MLNGLDKDSNIIIYLKRQYYFTLKTFVPGKSSTNVMAPLIFDEVTKLKESNIIVAGKLYPVFKIVRTARMGKAMLDRASIHITSLWKPDPWTYFIFSNTKNK